MKNDYTYIALLDENSTQKVRSLQERLQQELEYSSYPDQWPPHITIACGNLLNSEELELVSQNMKEVFKDQSNIRVPIEKLRTVEKTVAGETYCSLSFKLSPSSELDALSAKAVGISEKKEIPFDGFTSDRFHLSLGKYNKKTFENVNVDSLAPADYLGEILITKVALFYSMMNDPKPEKAHEVVSVEFI